MRAHRCLTNATLQRRAASATTTLRHTSCRLRAPLTQRTVGQHCRQFARVAVADSLIKEGNPQRYAYTLDSVTKRFDTGRTLFANLRLAFYDGAKIGVVGVNGSGKSSFLKIIAGIDNEYEGKAAPMPGYRVGYLPQEPQLDETKTVRENVEAGVCDKLSTLHRFEEIVREMENPEADFDTLIAEQSQLQEVIDSQSLWDLPHQIDRAMQALGCPSPESLTAHLSGGEKRRVALCRLLLSRPDILLLDEPTNHLDADSVSWLEAFLASYSGLVMAITHDRYFLDNVAGYILEIDSGRLFPHKGNYGSWLEARARRLELEKKKDAALTKMMARELAWVRSGQRGQQSKSKARLAGFEKLSLEKLERKKSKRSEGGAMCLPEGTELRETQILSVKNLTHWHDDKSPAEPILKNVSFSINKHDIVGIIGANGTGKTTLLKLLVGEKKVKQGSVNVGREVVYGYAGQHRQLNDNNPVWQEIIGVKETIQIDSEYSMPARAYVAQFNFSGTDQSKRCGQLSGGERNRASIAKALAVGCNVIVLDEPTNDLDVDTLRALEDCIQDWHGAAVIVSHDRWFLDRICTKILALDTDGGLTVYEGGYSEYEHEVKQKTRGGEERKKKFARLADK